MFELPFSGQKPSETAKFKYLVFATSIFSTKMQRKPSKSIKVSEALPPKPYIYKLRAYI
jgi:hypothetical protein